MPIHLIWCQDPNGGIGKNNKLPWSIAKEMDHFKKSTLNQVVVMGRKTFESIGRVLPNRVNVIISRNNNYKVEDAFIYLDPEKVLEDYKNQKFKNKDLWIIGGKTIYQWFLKYADFLHISEVKKIYDCDLFMKLDLSDFELIHKSDENEFLLSTHKKKNI